MVIEAGNTAVGRAAWRGFDGFGGGEDGGDAGALRPRGVAERFYEFRADGDFVVPEPVAAGMDPREEVCVRELIDDMGGPFRERAQMALRIAQLF